MTMHKSQVQILIKGISLHAVIFMLRKVEPTSDVNRGPEPCQICTALTLPALYRPAALSLRSIVQCRRMRMRMTTITIHVQNLTLSSLK